MSPSSLPDDVRAAAERALGTIRSVRPVSGGCISNGCRVETAAGPVFVKHNAAASAGMFAAEADGLHALRAAAGEHLRVPTVLALGDDGDRAGGWIALEWLEPAPPTAGDAERLGRGLAAIHRTSGRWGWECDNWIGSLPQANQPAASWPDFWRGRRLSPQLDLARRARRLPGTDAEWERLFHHLPELLAVGDQDGPSLLHGDLWSGNALSTSAGPAIIDPAVYRGHREVDLAMAALFGGFDRAFFAAYNDAWPLSPGAEQRRAIYQLYYLLVHVNLFGGGYVAQTAETLRRVLST